MLGKKIWHWKLLQNNLMSGNDLTRAELMPFWIRVHGLGCSPGYLLLLDPQTEDGVWYYLFCGKGVFFMHYFWTLAKTITSKSCCPQTLWQFLLSFCPELKMCQGTSIAFQITKCNCLFCLTWTSLNPSKPLGRCQSVVVWLRRVVLSSQPLLCFDVMGATFF